MIVYCMKCDSGNDSGKAVCQVCGHPLKAVEVPKEIIVTTGDLRDNYRIIGPVFFQVTNKGIFSSQLGKLKKEYEGKIAEMRTKGRLSDSTVDLDLWGVLIGEWSVGQTEFEVAFFIAVQELKKRAQMLGGDAIVSMRQDIDLDTNGFAYFYLQMYGTAVKIEKAAVA